MIRSFCSADQLRRRSTVEIISDDMCLTVLKHVHKDSMIHQIPPRSARRQRRSPERSLTDNLNTHTPAALYEAFPASEARRLAERFEWHFTPKHGSWLNMAESELATLSSQCLDRRIPDQRTLEREVEAWVVRRNTHNCKADWRFTTADARIKLKSLYPAL